MVTAVFFGITGNILINVTLIKIDLNRSIKISFCALGVSDFLCVTAFAWSAVCLLQGFLNSDLPFRAREVAILTGGGLTDFVCEITAWITAFITYERCLCVVFPHKDKEAEELFKIILTIFIITILPFLIITFYRYVLEKKLIKNQIRPSKE